MAIGGELRFKKAAIAVAAGFLVGVCALAFPAETYQVAAATETGGSADAAGEQGGGQENEAYSPVVTRDGRTNLATLLIYNQYGENPEVVQSIDEERIAQVIAASGPGSVAIETEDENSALYADAAPRAQELAAQASDRLAHDASDADVHAYIESLSTDERALLVAGAAEGWAGRIDDEAVRAVILDALNEDGGAAFALEVQSRLEDGARLVPESLDVLLAGDRTYEYSFDHVNVDSFVAADVEVDTLAAHPLIQPDTVALSQTPNAITVTDVSLFGSALEMTRPYDPVEKMFGVRAASLSDAEHLSSGYEIRYSWEPVVVAYTLGWGGELRCAYGAFRYQAPWSYTYEQPYQIVYQVEIEGQEQLETRQLEGTRVYRGVVEVDSPGSGALLGSPFAEPRHVSMNVEEATGPSDSVRVEGVSLATGTYEEGIVRVEGVSTVPLFPGGSALSRTVSLVGDESLVYYDNREGVALDGPFAANEELFASEAAHKEVIRLLDEPTVEQAEGFAIACDAATGSLLVKPLKATASEGEAAKVVWSYGDYQVTYDIVTAVLPKKISFELGDMPFRLREDNERAITQEANDAIRAAASETRQEGDPVLAGDYYAAVHLEGYDDNGSASIAYETDSESHGLSFDVATTAGAYANYEIEPARSVRVERMKALPWEEADVCIVAENVELENRNQALEHWINQVPRAMSDRYTLAYGTADVPREAEEFGAPGLSPGDGTHEFELFGLDRESGEVVRIVDLAYKLDRTPPALGEVRVTAEPKNMLDGILFGGGAIHVELEIRDAPDGGSGIDEPTLSITYDDAKSGRTGIGARVSGEAPFYSFDLVGNSDVASESIFIEVADRAGNVLQATGNAGVGPLLAYEQLVADAEAPALSVSWDNDDDRGEGYYAAGRTFSLSVQEAFFDYARARYPSAEIAVVTRGGESRVVLTPLDFERSGSDADTWVCSFPCVADGEWDVDVKGVTDLVGRSSSTYHASFVVDKTPPSLDVEFDNSQVVNGKYYNAPRTASVAIEECNFDEGRIAVNVVSTADAASEFGEAQVGPWVHDGNMHVLQVEFPGQGEYSLTVEGSDKASHELGPYQSPSFVIDTKAPEVIVEGVEDGRAYAGAARPSVAAHDANIDGEGFTVEVSKIGYPMAPESVNPYAPQRTTSPISVDVRFGDAAVDVANDGVYHLKVQAADLAGNITERAATWSVNRFGSTYLPSAATRELMWSCVQPGQVPDVKVTEINPSGLDETQMAIELACDTVTTTLERGEDYTVSRDDTSGWPAYSYRIGREAFLKDGTYRVLFYSRDLAENVSENTQPNRDEERAAPVDVRFSVDGQPPIASFVGLEGGRTYHEPAHRVLLHAEDNMTLDYAEVRVDGEAVLELDREALASAANHPFVVPSAAGPQTVEATVRDVAGNVNDSLAVHDVRVGVEQQDVQGPGGVDGEAAEANWPAWALSCLPALGVVVYFVRQRIYWSHRERKS